MQVIVHEFYVYELEDPDVHAATFLYNWESTERGRWAFKNSLSTPTWHRCHCGHSLGWKYIVKAELGGATLTEWLLKHEPTKSTYKYN